MEADKGEVKLFWKLQTKQQNHENMSCEYDARNILSRGGNGAHMTNIFNYNIICLKMRLQNIKAFDG